jgi:hypothetical protein
VSILVGDNGMTLARFSPLLCFPLLTGCISAGALNNEIRRSENNAGIDTPVNPCPEPAKSFSGQSKRSVDSGALLDARAVEGTDLELGLTILHATSSSGRLQAAAKLGPLADTLADDLGARLGINLAVLSEPDGIIDQQSVDLAEKVFSEPAFKAVVSTAEPQRLEAGNTTKTLSLSRDDWMTTAQTIGQATMRNGWYASFASSLGHYARTYGTTAIEPGSAHDQAGQSLTFRALIAAYMTDYFRNGEIVALDFGYDDLKAGLLKKLKEHIKDPTAIAAAQAEIDKLAKDLANQLCKAGSTAGKTCRVAGVIGEGSFVTRAGKSFAYPGVVVTFDSGADKKLSTNQVLPDAVISDLVRVVFEATGDSLFQVPGAKTSSLCKLTQPTTAAFCADDTTALDLQKVDGAADRVEAGAYVVTGLVVRGGWFFSLNNEALASSIQTALSVLARKKTEYAVWSKLHRCPTGRAAHAYERINIMLNQ